MFLPALSSQPAGLLLSLSSEMFGKYLLSKRVSRLPSRAGFLDIGTLDSLDNYLLRGAVMLDV